MPTFWTEDPARRAAARIPGDLRFKTKIEEALEMIERAVHDGLPREIVLADSAYGESDLFRETVRLRGLDYAAGVHARTKVWCLDQSERRRGEAIDAQELRGALGPRAFRRVRYNLDRDEPRKSAALAHPAASSPR